MGLPSMDIINGIFGDGGSSAAIKAQTNAANQANATNKAIYDSQRADLQPWRQAGIEALGQLDNPAFQQKFGMADFQADPGYNFRLQEGTKALERSAAARGTMGGGATMKALAGYNQNMASNEYANAYNRFNADNDRNFSRLSQLAGIGQQATGQVINAAGTYGNQTSANQLGLGNAIGSAAIGEGNKNAQLANGALQLGATALMFSDERLKTNIEPVTKEELQEMKAQLKAFRFNYKSKDHGAGDWIGVMAQDLEKSKLGRTLVVTDEYGNKQVSIPKVMSLFLATLAEA